MSETTPVEVSEWTRNATSAAVCLSASELSARGASPPGVRRADDVAPDTVASFCQRVPKFPCETASTFSPGESRLTTADSNAPVPDDVNSSTSFCVRKTCWQAHPGVREQRLEVG